LSLKIETTKIYTCEIHEIVADYPCELCQGEQDERDRVIGLVNKSISLAGLTGMYVTVDVLKYLLKQIESGEPVA